MTALESLNNAIERLARVSGFGSEASRLATDWNEWFLDDYWHSVGPIGLPWVYGTANGFWERYEAAYGELSSAERASVPTPASVEPTLARLASGAARQVVEANEAVAREAADAARAGGAMALTVVDEVERRSIRATWLVLVPIGLAIFLARRK